MRMKNPAHPRELVGTNRKELGLRGAEAAKTPQRLYNGTSDRSAATPEMAVRFETAFAAAAGMWLWKQAAHDLAKVRQSEDEIGASCLARPV
ncbi:MAG: helix-turn-helix transcriptional regulator [Methylocella sp.]